MPRRPSSALSLFAALLLLPVAAAAATAEAKVPQWYEIATGVLAIPAAIIGLAYSYLLIKKTRLESRKTELEILEKERNLKAADPEHTAEAAGELRSSENKLLLLLVVRFVVLYLVLQSWGLIEDAFELLFTGIVVGAQELFSLKLEGWSVLPFVALQKVPKVLYWVVFFALGWPLFKDANAALGLDVREYLRVSRRSARPRGKTDGTNEAGPDNDG